MRHMICNTIDLADIRCMTIALRVFVEFNDTGFKGKCNFKLFRCGTLDLRISLFKI